MLRGPSVGRLPLSEGPGRVSWEEKAELRGRKRKRERRKGSGKNLSETMWNRERSEMAELGKRGAVGQEEARV